MPRIDAEELETRVLAVWRRVLGVGSVAPDDDFYELGGTSLLAFEIAELLVEELELPAQDGDLLTGELLARATPRALTSRLLEYRDGSPWS